MTRILRLTFFILLLILFLGVMVWVSWWALRWATRPSLACAGGTLLVYEIDQERLPPGKTGSSYSESLVERLQRRLDPSDLYGIEVRMVDDNRVEIAIPHRPGDHPEDIDQIKELVSRLGILRFAILANNHDDKEALDEAWRMYGSLMTAERRAELKRDREKGIPPPPPSPPDNEGFPTPLGRYTYTWVELGPQMRHHYGLDNATGELPDNDPKKSLWLRMKEARQKDEVVEIPQLAGALLYSRDLPSERDQRLAKREQGRKIEYFVLSRDPDQPLADHEITGRFLRTVMEAPDEKGGLAVHFSFNAEGGRRLFDVTNKNKPQGGFYRHLAIVLDDLIMSAPTINSAIHESGQISGNFTKEEVDNLVNILRSGALPVPLKPGPLSETNVEPGK